MTELVSETGGRKAVKSLETVGGGSFGRRRSQNRHHHHRRDGDDEDGEEEEDGVSAVATTEGQFPVEGERCGEPGGIQPENGRRKGTVVCE